jgi:hypothetical protein
VGTPQCKSGSHIKTMKLTLTFEEKDFETMRTFDKAVKRQLGPNVYVGTDNLCFFFDYPKELAARLRPMYHGNQLEFELESSLPDAK